MSMWNHLPVEELQPPAGCETCLMSIRYANIFHAQLARQIQEDQANNYDTDEALDRLLELRELRERTREA